VLCNNAGVFTAGASWQVPMSDYEWVFGVNIFGVLHGIRSFVPMSSPSMTMSPRLIPMR
jgi:NADP-dependent 3-hydroxy acid dehydrogenase YdfG